MRRAWLDTLPPSLMAAIDALYPTFASYPWRKTIRVLHHFPNAHLDR